MKEGLKFEHLATEVFTILCKDREFEKVEHNVFLDGPDGPRQIDVLISGSVGPFEVKTIIECKDYDNNVNVIAVDALYSKLLDVNAQKAVLVARKGFTSGAKKKAKRLGISLCTIHSMDQEKWKFEIEIPILITECACEKFSPSMVFTAICEKV
ncbi:MAG: restriction endonuclease, partial [Saprospiraceae bacterium]|nr:restriction endonuclease [Saprospiraceae bacterium]